MRELHTARLLLRPLAVGDRDFYVGLHTDAAVMRHIGTPLSEEQAGRAFENSRRLGADLQPRYWIWVMEQRLSNQTVGLLGLRTTDPCVGEIGAMLVPTAWGQGHAAEAITRVVEHAFSELGFVRLLTRHRAGHGAARSLMAGLDFGSSAGEAGEERWELQRDRWMAGSRDQPRSEMEPPVNLC